VKPKDSFPYDDVWCKFKLEESSPSRFDYNYKFKLCQFRHSKNDGEKGKEFEVDDMNDRIDVKSENDIESENYESFSDESENKNTNRQLN
jgi:hypothetical protein